ncbi:MAG TPA: hypothetical protein VGQ81_08500 [Acidobacteriota bacterium]|jgi:hypothetical protein|nr:hypothetical protein [Acidobacteriota bacterium]
MKRKTSTEYEQFNDALRRGESGNNSPQSFLEEGPTTNRAFSNS